MSKEFFGYILTTGNEITSGLIQDTNKTLIAQKLESLGVTVLETRSIRDNSAELQLTLAEIITKADIVIVTGGLGPTMDDITVRSVARLLKSSIKIEPQAEKKIKARYKSRKKNELKIANKQAEYPEACEPLRNPKGLAVGFSCDLNKMALNKKVKSPKGKIFFLPGVPYELEAMMEIHVLFWLKALNIKKKSSLKFNTFGISESLITYHLEKIFSLRKKEDLLFSISFQEGIGCIFLSPIKDMTKKELTRVKKDVEKALEPFLLPEGTGTIAGGVHSLLIKNKKTLSIAESCTGGSIAKRLVEFPGSSEYFKIGWITYSNESKIRQLGVSKRIINSRGAVSGECVREMLIKALKKSGTDYAIAVSGIAGPTGGSPEKPVGTVYTGVAKKIKTGSNRKKINCFVEKNLFPGNRQRIINLAGQKALFQLLKIIQKD